MAIFQRQPAEVILGMGGPAAAELTQQATAAFLDQNRWQRLVPCAGLMLRGALDPLEVEQMIEGDNNALHQPDFLEPANQAMQAWWKKQPQADKYNATNLKFNSYVIEPAPPHIDQYLDRGVRPVAGPLTAIAALAEDTTYYLHNSGLSCFSPRGIKDILHIMDREPIENRGLTITSHPGDVLLIPNIYPTHHQSIAPVGRLAVTYESKLELITAKPPLYQATADV